MAGSDHTLMVRWISQRDAEAFRALAERYGGMVYATGLRVLGDPQASEDLAQECFEALAMARRAHCRSNLPPNFLAGND